MDDLENYRATLLHYIKLCASSWWRHQMNNFPRYWPFVRGIHRSPVNSPHKGQWRGTLMFSLTYAWIRGWVNYREAGDLRRHQAHYDLIVMISHPSVNSNKIYCPETLNSGQNRQFFVPCDLEIWWMTLKNNRAPPLYYIKLCASFKSHMWFQTGVTVRKRLIRIQIDNFLSHVTLKFDVLPWKTIGHLFYVASSFMHHFIAMGEFKVNLQVGNAQFGSKSAIYCPVWHWFLCGWPCETIGHLFYVASSFMHHFIAIGKLKQKLHSGNAQFGSKLAIFCPVWPWNLTDDLEKQ